MPAVQCGTQKIFGYEKNIVKLVIVGHTPRMCLHNAYGDFVFLKLRNSCSAVCLCSLLTMFGGACK